MSEVDAAGHDVISASAVAVKTLRVKVKSGQSWLNEASTEVNQVWNFANQASERALKPYAGKPKALSGFDLVALTSGATYEFACIGAHTVQEVCQQYAVKRRKAKRARLKWRASFGAKRALGWVPFKRGNARFKDGAVVFCGQRFRVFDSYGLDQYDLRAGSFAQDALGDWYFNAVVQVECDATDVPSTAVGIDLGLKDTATCSDGVTLAAGQFYRGIEEQIGQAQRNGHKRQAKRLHRTAARRRKDALHKFSGTVVKKHGCIYVGDVSSTNLVKTKMAKSVLDSGWGMLKTMLIEKGHRAGRIVEVVNERNTTRACSECGSLSGPQGLRGLVERSWICEDCGAVHERDVNAARNILARSRHRPPSAGTLLDHAEAGRTPVAA